MLLESPSVPSYLCVAELPGQLLPSVAGVSQCHSPYVAELPAVASCCPVLLDSPIVSPCVAELPAVASCCPVLLESHGVPPYVLLSCLLLPSVAGVSQCP